MRNIKNSKIAAAVALVCTIAAAPLVSAKPIRFDDGTASGNSGIWDPQTAVLPSFGTQLDLGFNLNFFGTTAAKLQVDTTGVELLDSGGGQLGSITVLGIPGDAAVYGASVSATSDPLPPLDGVAITDAFRVTWQLNSPDLQFQAQIALFQLANGDSLFEFNYASDLAGLNLPIAGVDVGLINPLAGGGFNLLDALAGNACLSHFGGEQADDGCTGYFAGQPIAAVAGGLPSQFIFTNGGDALNDEVADFRYLVRFGNGTVTPPTTTVPEPTTWSLLLAGVAALLAAKRRRSARVDA
jgi:hypothetical protein